MSQNGSISDWGYYGSAGFHSSQDFITCLSMKHSILNECYITLFHYKISMFLRNEIALCPVYGNYLK